MNTHTHTQIHSYLFLSFITTHLTLSASMLLLRSCQLNYSLANSLNNTKAKICLQFLNFNSQVHLTLVHYCFWKYHLFLNFVLPYSTAFPPTFSIYFLFSLPSLAIKYWSVSVIGSRYFSLLSHILPKKSIKYAGTSLLTDRIANENIFVSSSLDFTSEFCINSFS